MPIKRYIFSICASLLALPVIYVSYDILSAFTKSYPLRSQYQSIKWRHSFFIKHYANDPSALFSDFNPLATQLIADILRNKSYYLTYDKSESEIIQRSIYQIYHDLYAKYPHNIHLNFKHILSLWKNQKYMQAYKILQKTYIIAPCYRYAMESRIALKDNLGLYIINKIENDIKGIKFGKCFTTAGGAQRLKAIEQINISY